MLPRRLNIYSSADKGSSFLLPTSPQRAPFLALRGVIKVQVVRFSWSFPPWFNMAYGSSVAIIYEPRISFIFCLCWWWGDIVAPAGIFVYGEAQTMELSTLLLLLLLLLLL